MAPPAMTVSECRLLPTVYSQLSTYLLYFNLCARIFELLLEALGVRLGNAFLDVLRGAVHQVLGFLQTELGKLTHRLNYLDLLGTRLLENDRELGLLGRGSSATSRGSHARGGNGNRSRLDAPLILKLLRKSSDVHHGQ